MADPIDVRVVCAWPDRIFDRRVTLTEGATIADAVASSGLCADEPALIGSDIAYAIHGRIAHAGTRLKRGDRVEVLRPLRIDPKTARRRRAAEDRPK